MFPHAYTETKYKHRGAVMEIWKAAILGIAQGVTEFLPVSSSGHLLLLERLLGVDTGGADLFLGVMLHAGTLLAVLFVYARRLAEMIRRDRKELAYLFVATIPAALVGVLLGGWVERVFFAGRFLWVAFAWTALLLFLCSAKVRRGYTIRLLNMKRAAWVGGAQALAVIPGLSRSGTTLAAGIFCGLSRDTAADFSFLMSIPIIAGAVTVELWKVWTGGHGAISVISWQSLLVGTVCAALSGFISVRWFVKKIRTGNLYPFAIYLSIMAIVLAFCERWL